MTQMRGTVPLRPFEASWGSLSRLLRSAEVLEGEQKQGTGCEGGASGRADTVCVHAKRQKKAGKRKLKKEVKGIAVPGEGAKPQG